MRREFNRDDYQNTPKGIKTWKQALEVFEPAPRAETPAANEVHGFIVGIMFAKLFPKKADLLIGSFLNEPGMQMPKDVFDTLVNQVNHIAGE